GGGRRRRRSDGHRSLRRVPAWLPLRPPPHSVRRGGGSRCSHPRPRVVRNTPVMTERPTPALDPQAVLLVEHGIRDTIARYAHHVDDGEFEALSRLFTADGEFIIDRF